jgi:hypothetical protein
MGITRGLDINQIMLDMNKDFFNLCLFEAGGNCIVTFLLECSCYQSPSSKQNTGRSHIMSLSMLFRFNVT